MMLVYMNKNAGLYIKELLLKNSPKTDVDVIDLIYQIDEGLKSYENRKEELREQEAEAVFEQLGEAARRTMEVDS